MKTTKMIAAFAAVCAATGAAYADTTIANSITLTADTDWRADGVVTVPQGVTVDLNGHALANSGEITVNLAGRTDLKTLARSANPRLFTWPLVDGNPVVPGADFVLDPATAAAGFRVRKDATGLRFVNTRGMMLIVK